MKKLNQTLIIFRLKKSQFTSLRILSLFYLILATFYLIGCKKNTEVSNSIHSPRKDVDVIDNRIAFSSKAAFDNFLSNAVKNSDVDLKTIPLDLKEKISTTSFKRFKDVESIKVSSKISRALIARQQLKSLPKLMSTNHNETVMYAAPYEPPPSENPYLTPDEEVTPETLVPDGYFASVLNEDGEVLIDATVYKVTPYGTFITKPEQIDIVDSLIDNEIVPSLENQTLVQEDLYEITPGVLRYDTYNQQTEEIVEIGNLPIDQSSANLYSNTTYPNLPCTQQPTYPYISATVYDGLPSYSFDAQTWAGKTLQKLFGRTKPHYASFSSRDRVKVNFYSVNFYVYSSVGVNVKMQYKGWTGIWRKQDAQELRLGWDGIVLKQELRGPDPDYATFSSTGAPFVKHYLENYKFAKIKNFPFAIPVVKIPFTNKPLEDELLKMVNNQITSSINNLVKKGMDYMETQLAPGQVEWRCAQTKAFQMVAPSSITTIMNRYEETASNTDDITNNFDWSTAEVGFTYGDGGFKFKWSDNALSYEIVRGSIYGLAKFNNEWKGVRIVK